MANDKNTPFAQIVSILMKKKFVILLLCALMLIFAGGVYALQSMRYETTKDAFVEGHLMQIASNVAGRVVNLYVNDNQVVKQNQILAEIDSDDYKTMLKQAETRLSDAKAKLGALETQAAENSSKAASSAQNLSAIASKLEMAEKDYTKSAEMYKEGIISKQEYDNRLENLTAVQSDKKEAEVNNKAINTALEASKANVKIQEAEIKRFEREVELAKSAFSDTKILAPEDGMISERMIKKGEQVKVAQPVFSLIPQRVWVVANFKENQAAKMKKGQLVLIKIDKFPYKKFKGHVDRIQVSGGAEPENNNENSVKIVQKVPVKIMFDEDVSDYNIAPGTAVEALVRLK